MEKHIFLVNDDQEIPFKNEKSILELLIKHKVPVDHSCDGMGSCGTCRILIRSDLGVLPPRNEVEQERASDLNFAPHERLACQLSPMDKLKIEVPPITEG